MQSITNVTPPTSALRTPPSLPPVTSAFSPYNPEDKRNISALKVHLLSKDSSPTILSLEHFKVCFHDRNGTHLHPPTVYTFERKQKDKVLDLLPFTFIDGTLYIAISQCLRPSLVARTLLNSLETAPESGLHWGLSGAHLSPHEPLDTQIKKILIDRVGAFASRPPFSLGGGYYPSIGTSTEFCLPYAIEILPEKNYPLVKYGANFEAMRLCNLVSAQDLVDAYLQGELRDSRLIFCLFRLCEMLGYRLSISMDLPTASLPKLGLRVQKRIFSLDQLRNPLSIRNPHHRSVESLSILPAPSPSSMFLSHQRLLVENHSAEGRILHWYQADLCSRKGLDSVDVGCYFHYQKSLYTAVKCGIRPILAAYPSYEDSLSIRSPFELSGVAESLEGETTMQQINSRARQGIREELELEPTSDAQFIGTSYPSPGTNPERVFSFLCSINPQEKALDTHTSLDETVGCGFARVDDILRLGREAYITDYRYLLGAYFLKAAFQATKKAK